MESDRVRGDASNVDSDDKDTVLFVQRRFLEEYPSYKDCTIVLINCLNMGDPHHDRDLRTHKGARPRTME
eukprot:1521989-Karenia_brevis.AAC.1